MTTSKIVDSYIKQVQLVVQPDLNISAAAVKLLKEYLTPLLAPYNVATSDPTVVLEDLNSLTFSLLPGDLSKHAINDGDKAWTKNNGWLKFKVNFDGSKRAGYYANAVLEYLTAEFVDVAGGVALENGKKTITPALIAAALEKDPELKQYVKTVYGETPKKSAKSSVKKSAKSSVKKSAKKGSRKTSKGRGYAALTVPVLRAKAKERGLSGYSKLKKDDLIDLLRSKRGSRKSSKKSVRKSSKKSAKKDLTVVELRALCKKKGVKGYSKMRKADLLKACK